MYHAEDVELPANFDAPPRQLPPAMAALREAAAAGHARESGPMVFAGTEREAREALALNYGSIANIDEAAGRMMASLRRHRLDDHIVVLFTSDHCELLGEHGLMLQGSLHCQALTRVPSIWRDTLGQRHARRTQALAKTLDIGTTVLARADPAPVNGIQGVSLLVVIHGYRERAPDWLVVEEGMGRAAIWACRDACACTCSLITPHHRLTLYARMPPGVISTIAWRTCTSGAASGAAAQALRVEFTHELALQMIRRTDTGPCPEASA